MGVVDEERVLGFGAERVEMEILGRDGRRSRLRISSVILPPKTRRRVWGSGRRAHAEFYYKRQRQMDWALEILQRGRVLAWEMKFWNYILTL